MVSARNVCRWVGDKIAEFMEVTLGRRLFSRISRFLWFRSRLNFPNDFEKNGEELVLEAVASEAGPNENLRVFDIGANVGEWSCRLTELLRDEHSRDGGIELHCFEPAPASVRQLRQRLENSELPEGTVVNELAVSDQLGEADLNIRAPTAGTNALHVTKEENISHTVNVGVTTIDKYCRDKDIKKIDFVKIDTEGNDFNVLAGAQGLLEDGSIRAIQFEYNRRWVNFRCYLKDVFSLIKTLDYKVGKVTPFGIEVYSEWDYELENFVEANFLIYKGKEFPDLDRVKYWKE